MLDALAKIVGDALSHYDGLQFTVAVLVVLTALGSLLKVFLFDRRRPNLEIDPVAYLMANIDRVEHGAHARMDRIDADIVRVERQLNRDRRQR